MEQFVALWAAPLFFIISTIIMIVYVAIHDRDMQNTYKKRAEAQESLQVHEENDIKNETLTESLSSSENNSDLDLE